MKNPLKKIYRRQQQRNNIMLKTNDSDSAPYFSPIEGYIIQQEHLTKWQKILKPEIFAKLKAWAEEDNFSAHSGYEIRRGEDLSNFVFNNLVGD